MKDVLWVKLGTIVLLIGLSSIHTPCLARKFNMISNLDEGVEIPVKTYRKMGIQQGWFHCPLPIKIDEKGDAVWSDEKLAKKVKGTYEKFENSDLKVFLVVGLWRTYFEDEKTAKQKSFYDCEWTYRSFSSDTKKAEKCLKFLVAKLKTYKCFGGICLDDEPAIIAGGCYNDRCVALFKKKYGIAPPSKKDFSAPQPGLIKADNPVLLWLRFQRTMMFDYYQKLLRAVRSIDPVCPVYTIPAGNWVCGKTISHPDSSPEKTKLNTLGTLDPIYIKDFQLYTQYAFTVLDENGWSAKIADGLCQNQFAPPNCPRNVVPIFHPDPNGKGISPVAFKRYVLQTYAEGAKGIGYWPIRYFSKKVIQTAEKIYNDTIKTLDTKTPDLIKLKGRVAVLYSTSTAVFDSVWINNPIERFEHIHQCEALEYYLLKRGIPFDLILEDELRDARDLKDYRAIISSGIRFLESDKAKILEKYAKDGGRLILDKSSPVKLKGALSLDFNANYWYETLKTQNQRESDLEYQAGLLDSVLHKIIPDSLAICQSPTRRLNINYLSDGKDVYVFVVNNDLSGTVRTTLTFEKKSDVKELLDGTEFSNVNTLPIELSAGSLKAFMVKH